MQLAIVRHSYHGRHTFIFGNQHVTQKMFFELLFVAFGGYCMVHYLVVESLHFSNQLLSFCQPFYYNQTTFTILLKNIDIFLIWRSKNTFCIITFF